MGVSYPVHVVYSIYDIIIPDHDPQCSAHVNDEQCLPVKAGSQQTAKIQHMLRCMCRGLPKAH